jgi:hypothetical protein
MMKPRREVAVAMSEAEMGEFLSGLGPKQGVLIQDLRDLVARGAPKLDEYLNTGAWLTGYLFYGTPESGMVLAIGGTRAASVTFHAMPWYASPAFRENDGKELAPYESGKSCFRFGAGSTPPMQALASVVAAAPCYLDVRSQPRSKTPRPG